jgi:hypothetical protein
MMLSDFINHCISQYTSISFFDSLRSTMPVYFFIAFFILYVGGMIALLSGVKDAKWVLLFCGILFFVGWSWVKLYQHYELKTPVKKKVFNYRLAKALGMVNLAPEISVSRKGVVSGHIENSQTNYKIIIRYTQDLWRNVGGIIPGTPVQTLRKIHARTWFLEIRGKTDVSGGNPVEYNFSARKDDDDTEDGFGVHLYAAKTYAKLNPKTDDPKKIAQQIRKAIDNTILKGTLTFDDGDFILRIFDNIETIRRWQRPAVVYKSFQNDSRLANAGILPEQTAFYGIDKVISILVQ